MTVDSRTVVPRLQINLGVEPTLRGSLAQLTTGRVVVIDYFAGQRCGVVMAEESIPWGGPSLIVGTGADGRLPIMAQVSTRPPAGTSRSLCCPQRRPAGCPGVKCTRDSRVARLSGDREPL